MNILETEKLILKRISMWDAEKIYSLTSDVNVAKFMRFNTHTNISEAKELIEEYMLKGNHGFIIVEKESEEFVGVFALKQVKDQPNTFSLSTFSAPKFWNKGYNTEILKYIKIYAKENLKAASLKAYVVSDNISSLKVIQKNGFSFDDKLIFPDLPQGLLIYTLNLKDNNE